MGVRFEELFSMYFSSINVASVSSVLFIGVLSQLFVVTKRTLIKEENNKKQPKKAETIVVNTHWIERKNSEGKTLDLNNNIVQIH